MEGGGTDGPAATKTTRGEKKVLPLKLSCVKCIIFSALAVKAGINHSLDCI